MRCARVTRCSPPRPPPSTQRRRGAEFWQVIAHSLHADMQQGDVKVDQQPQLLPRQPQIGQQLRTMNRQELFNGFQLDNDTSVDHKVDLEIRSDVPSFVFDWNSPLTLE